MSDTVYYSQFGEDRILSEIFRGTGRGTCVEVGANDGITDSVTFFFEKIGWHCILIEPNPELCRLIRANRKATLHECAASDRAGFTTLYIAEGADRAHGVSTICATEEAKSKIKAYGFTTRPVEVITRELDDILAESNIEHGIDFISIDVEGHEYEVLKGFSLQRWAPKIIVIEDNSNHANPLVRNYLKRHGYISFKRTGVNDWFATRTQGDLLSWANRGRYLLGFLKARAASGFKKMSTLGK